MSKSYQELIKLRTFEERYEYLKLEGGVGIATFGSHRFLNQVLYTSPEWKRFRHQIIIRDNGCDLASEGHSINGDRIIIRDNGCDLAPEGHSINRNRIIIHHLNPLTIEDIQNRDRKIFDPDNVVCVSHLTHEAIHYGDRELLPVDPVERRPGDTLCWN